MKTLSIYSYSLVLAVAACAIIPNCSQSVDQDIAGTTTTATTTTTAKSATIAAFTCTPVMSGATSERLQDYLQPGEGVTNVEPPVHYCLTMSGSSAALTLQFEADAGIFQAKQTNTLVAKKTISGSITSIEIIFEDSMGLVGIKGSKNTSSTAAMPLTVSYYNFPSYQEALDEAIEELREKCNSGAMTVAACMGVTPPLPWWKDPAYQSGSAQALTKARSILADSTKSSVLGTIAY